MSLPRCKECSENNYGWCKNQGKQIKQITMCDFNANPYAKDCSSIKVTKQEVQNLYSNNEKVRSFMLENPTYYSIVQYLTKGCTGEELLKLIYKLMSEQSID